MIIRVGLVLARQQTVVVGLRKFAIVCTKQQNYVLQLFTLFFISITPPRYHVAANILSSSPSSPCWRSGTGLLDGTVSFLSSWLIASPSTLPLPSASSTTMSITSTASAFCISFRINNSWFKIHYSMTTKLLAPSKNTGERVGVFMCRWGVGVSISLQNQDSGGLPWWLALPGVWTHVHWTMCKFQCETWEIPTWFGLVCLPRSRLCFGKLGQLDSVLPQYGWITFSLRNKASIFQCINRYKCQML